MLSLGWPVRPPNVGVVEIVVAKRGAVGEGGEIGRDASAGADLRRRPLARRQRDVAADTHRLLVERRDAAADGVDDEGTDLLDGLGIDDLEAQAVRIGGEPFGERRLCPGGAMNGRQCDGGGQQEKLAASERHGGRLSHGP
jgi:hypothetical protein